VLREYWGEKVLEWSRSPEEALCIALPLNDRYGLDGRDPNGCTGIAMVVGGLNGRPWNQKGMLGKVRKLTHIGERPQYDVHAFYEKVARLWLTRT
jgi:deoxyribodipyrimidine photo-lyase